LRGGSLIDGSMPLRLNCARNTIDKMVLIPKKEQNFAAYIIAHIRSN